MTEIQNPKQYDLEERTYQFAKRCGDYVKKLPRTISNFEYSKQLINASGSQVANYIEANKVISKKDFFRTESRSAAKRLKKAVCS